MDLFEHIIYITTSFRHARDSQASIRAKPSNTKHVGHTSGRARNHSLCISHDEHANSGTNLVAQSSFRFEVAGSDVRLVVQIAQQSDRPA